MLELVAVRTEYPEDDELFDNSVLQSIASLARRYLDLEKGVRNYTKRRRYLAEGLKMALHHWDPTVRTRH